MEPQMSEKPGPVNLMIGPDHAVMSPPGEAPEAARQGGQTVGKPTPEARREDREKAARVAEQLAELSSMTTAELAAKFETLTGRAPRSRNNQWLRKRVAWHLQAAEYGGLSEAALAKIDELAPLAMKLFGQRRKGRAKVPRSPADRIAGPGRDPRLPEPGTVLRRAHGGTEHAVTVLADGFEFRGARYRSLSKIAREITGTPWNGFAWFGLADRRSETREDAA